VHLDLRDDNVLIGSDGQVWFVDWNWPVRGAAWVDLVCLLLSAFGDGHDADALLKAHPLTRGVDPESVNCLLAVLLTHWACALEEPVPPGSPHLRDHQAWYFDVTRRWLEERLASASAACVRPGSSQRPRLQSDEPEG
jgi:Ser/Thr protein kinase RdoA (MazF antagonist)